MGFSKMCTLLKLKNMVVEKVICENFGCRCLPFWGSRIYLGRFWVSFWGHFEPKVQAKMGIDRIPPVIKTMWKESEMCVQKCLKPHFRCPEMLTFWGPLLGAPGLWKWSICEKRRSNRQFRDPKMIQNVNLVTISMTPMILTKMTKMAKIVKMDENGQNDQNDQKVPI